MLHTPKTVLDSVCKADSYFDIFKIVKISYFLNLTFRIKKKLELGFSRKQRFRTLSVILGSKKKYF